MTRPSIVPLREHTLIGPDIGQIVEPLAALRIAVFRDFPYLYDGDLDYERGYLATYVQSPAALAHGIYDGQALVGATTALPLVDEEAAFQRPLIDAGFDPAQVFYFGESILLGDYRGRGLGHRFFDVREARARALGFSVCAFCAVQRDEHHSARPADYVPLDDFWRRRGYAPCPQAVARYAWTDVGDDAQTDKSLLFWTRALD